MEKRLSAPHVNIVRCFPLGAFTRLKRSTGARPPSGAIFLPDLAYPRPYLPPRPYALPILSTLDPTRSRPYSPLTSCTPNLSGQRRRPSTGDPTTCCPLATDGVLRHFAYLRVGSNPEKLCSKARRVELTVCVIWRKEAMFYLHCQQDRDWFFGGESTAGGHRLYWVNRFGISVPNRFSFEPTVMCALPGDVPMRDCRAGPAPSNPSCTTSRPNLVTDLLHHRKRPIRPSPTPSLAHSVPWQGLRIWGLNARSLSVQSIAPMSATLAKTSSPMTSVERNSRINEFSAS